MTPCNLILDAQDISRLAPPAWHATLRHLLQVFASLLSSIGTWAQQVAEPWLLLTLGASSFVIGLDSFAMNAPVWLLTLEGGALADRRDRREVILLFQSIQMLCPIAIVILLITGGIRPWMIVALSVVVGVTDALSMPSFQSIVPSIVPREQIGAGLALNSTQFNLSRILGPSIAGVLMSSVGVMACFVVSALSYVPFIGVALWILPRWTPPPRPADAPPKKHLFAGIRDILRQPNPRGALLMVLATGILCGPLITFTPVLVKEAFNGSAGRFSIAVASFGAGGIGLAPPASSKRCAECRPAADKLRARPSSRRYRHSRLDQSVVLGAPAAPRARRRCDDGEQ